MSNGNERLYKIKVSLSEANTNVQIKFSDDCNYIARVLFSEVYYAAAPRVGALSDDARLTSVCLTSV